MNKQALFGRPYVAFDVDNRDHRRWFANFTRERSWGSCPVRFVVNDDNGDLISLIQRKLIQYYVDREFGTVSGPKIRAKIAGKRLTDTTDGDII